MRLFLSIVITFAILIGCIGLGMARTQWRAQFDLAIAIVLGLIGVLIITYFIYQII